MVNGAALVYTGTGTAGALELLGYTEQGVDQDVTENKAEIITDLFGPMTPQDFQDMGMVARIICPFIALDRTVLAKVMNRGDRTTVGSLNTPGLVLGVGGHAFRVGIASPFDTPWSFSKCILRNSGTRLATKANPFRQEFFAWPYASYTVTTGKDAQLWTRTLSLVERRDVLARHRRAAERWVMEDRTRRFVVDKNEPLFERRLA